jgi:alcohol dehydrogenase (cytochrome c)
MFTHADVSVRRSFRRALLGSIVALPFALVVAISAAPSAAAPAGGYTAAQAAQGASVDAANCSACHAENLAGGAGPTLIGTAFKKSIDANYHTAAELYDFISKQMPLSAPGSLSHQNYSPSPRSS